MQSDPAIPLDAYRTQGWALFRGLVALMGILLMGSGLIGLPTSQAQQPWPTASQNLQRTAQAPNSASTGDWEALGKAGVDATAAAPPAIGPEGNLFYARFNADNGEKSIFEFSADTGAQRNKGTLSGRPVAQPVITDRYVFVATMGTEGSARLEIFDLDLNPGGAVPLNLSALPTNVLSPPSVAPEDERAYILVGSGSFGRENRLVAVDYSDPQAPTSAWSVSVGNATAITTPAAPVPTDDGPILTAGRDGVLRTVSFDGTTTNVLFDPDIPNAFSTPALAEDGTIYLVNEGGEGQSTLYALTTEGSTNWSQSFSKPATPPTIGPDGAVHVATRTSSSTTVHAHNDDGSEKWTASLSGAVSVPPAIDENGAVYVAVSPTANAPGQIVRIGQEGTVEWRQSVGGAGAPPVQGLALAADRTVYVARPGDQSDFPAVLRSEQVLDVTSTAPAQNGPVDRTEALDITFSEPIPSQPGLADSIVVRGSQSGIIGGVARANGTRTVTYTPNGAFAPGETVTVTLRGGIEDTRGVPLGTAYTYELTATAATGPAEFPLAQTVSMKKNGPQAVAVGDLDGDGDRDLVVGTAQAGTVTRYMNEGDGRFTSGTVVGTEVNDARDVILADLDGQNGLDIVVAAGKGSDGGTNSDDEISWYANTGEGTFGTRQDVADIDVPNSIAVADLEGDGDADIVAASGRAGTVYWYENDGDGGFTPNIISDGLADPRAVAVGDIAQNGTPDVVFSDVSSDEVVWVQNQGDGTFASGGRVGGSSPADPVDVDLADLDGNGLLDAVIATEGRESVNVVLDNGAGDLATAGSTLSTSGGPSAVHVADVTGDQNPDLLAAADSSFHTFINDGTGSFPASRAFAARANQTQDIVATDLDGDNTLDPVGTTYGDTTAVALYPNIPAVSASSSSVTAQPTTVNADGSATATLTIELRDAEGNPVSGLSGQYITLSGLSNASATPITERGNGVYETDLTNTTPEDVTVQVTAGGMVLDDTPTVIFSGEAQSVAVTTQPFLTIAGQPIDGPPAATVTDANGTPVPGVEVTVRETGGYTFDGGTTTVTTNASGSARFDDLLIETAGVTYRLTFAIETNDGIAEARSTTFLVGPAAPDQLALTGPSTVTAGQVSENFTLEVQDAFGNPAPITFQADFVLSSTSGETATFSTNPVSRAAPESTTFTYKNTEASEQTITAEAQNLDNGVLSDATATTSITVEPAAAEALAYGQQPTPVEPGAVIAPPVEVHIKDTYGNLVPGATNDVSVSLGTDPTEGTASLSGTLTQSASDGIATFGDLSIDASANGYTLHAAADGLDSTASATFDVTALTAPTISGVRLTNDGSNNLAIILDSDKPLSALTVTVDGPSTPDAYRFTRGDFTESKEGSNYTYTLDTEQPYDDGEGTYTATVEEARNLAGNADGPDGEEIDLSDNHGFAPPEVTAITRSSPSGKSTNSTSATFTVAFSEQIENLSAAEFSVTSPEENASINAVRVSAPDTTVTVTNITGEGTVGLDVTPSMAQDSSGNPLQSSEPSTDQTYTIDRTAPLISDVALGTHTSTGGAVRIDNGEKMVLRFTSNEPLGTGSEAIQATVDGPNTDGVYRFDRTAFDEVNEAGAYEYALTTNQTYDDGPGKYEAVVDVARDPAGNNGGVSGQGNGLTATMRGISIDVQVDRAVLNQPVEVVLTTEGGFNLSGPEATRRLSFRKSGTNTYRDTALTVVNSNSLRASIPKDVVTSRGVDYCVTLSWGEKTLTVPAGGTTVATGHPAHLPVSFEALSPPDTTQQALFPQERYRMVSVPARPNSGIKAALRADYGPYNRRLWRLERWNAADATYNGFPALDSLRPGDGFWLTTKRGEGFTLSAGRTVRADTAQKIPLKTGWNQIGTPFGFAVPWDTIRAASNAPGDSLNVDGPVGYRDGRFQTVRTQLTPWRGYFLYNAKGRTDTLTVPPVGHTGASSSQALAAEDGGPMRPDAQLATAGAGSAQKADSDRYTLRVKALTKNGTAQAHLGLWPDANVGRGPYDHAEPPAVTEGLQLSALEEVGDATVPHSYSIKPPVTGQASAADESGPDAERKSGASAPGGRSWSLRLRAPGKGRTAKLRLQETGALPSGHRAYLLDLDREQRITRGAELDVNDGETRRLKVIVGTEAYARQHNEGISLSSFETTLRANAPNPFARKTTVEYVVAEAMPVTIEVYNALGQRVETLVDGRKRAGVHRTTWDGGTRFGSGVYFLRLRAGDVTDTQKAVVVR